MKKLLVDLQISSVDSFTRNFKVLSDSNFDFNLSYFKHLSKEYNIVFLLPNSLEDQDVVENYLEQSSIDYDYVQKNKLPFDERFNIDLDGYKRIINRHQPDIIFCNNPCIVGQFKLISNAKLVSYNHWIDSYRYPKDYDINRKSTYIFRQAESLFFSDSVLLNSNFAKDIFIDSFSQFFTNAWVDYNYYKIKIIPPLDTFDDFEKDDYTSNDIIFNHRLSSFPYYKDNLDNCIKLIESLKGKYRLKLTDNSGKGFDQNKCNDVIKYLGCLSSNDLKYNLQKSSIHLSLFEPGNGAMWSISIMRAIQNKNVVILPEHSGYVEMAPRGYFGFVKSVDQAREKLERLYYDISFRKQLAEDLFQWFKTKYDIKNYVEQLKIIL